MLAEDREAISVIALARVALLSSASGLSLYSHLASVKGTGNPVIYTLAFILSQSVIIQAPFESILRFLLNGVPVVEPYRQATRPMSVEPSPSRDAVSMALYR